MEPALDVLGGHLDILELVVALATAIGRSDLRPVPHNHPVILVQEIGRLEVLWNHEDADACPDERDDAFDDVQPEFLISSDAFGDNERKGEE